MDERLADGRTVLQAYDSLFALAPKFKPKDLVLTPYTSKPRISNIHTVRQLLTSLYPPGFRDTGRGGRATVSFVIRPDGRADHIRILRSSGHGQLDVASTTIVHQMRFSPATNGSCPVPFFVSQPISWRVE